MKKIMIYLMKSGMLGLIYSIMGFIGQNTVLSILEVINE